MPNMTITWYIRAGFDTRYRQVSQYFASSIPIFCGFRYFPVSNFGSSVRRYFDTSIFLQTYTLV